MEIKNNILSRTVAYPVESRAMGIGNVLDVVFDAQLLRLRWDLVGRHWNSSLKLKRLEEYFSESVITLVMSG